MRTVDKSLRHQEFFQERNYLWKNLGKAENQTGGRGARSKYAIHCAMRTPIARQDSYLDVFDNKVRHKIFRHLSFHHKNARVNYFWVRIGIGERKNERNEKLSLHDWMMQPRNCIAIIWSNFFGYVGARSPKTIALVKTLLLSILTFYDVRP